MAYIRSDYICVIGTIWMPSTTAATQYNLSSYDLRNISETEEYTRENVERWLAMNSGDFQSVDDFSASIGDVEIPWQDEESEFTYFDCMYPAED